MDPEYVQEYEELMKDPAYYEAYEKLMKRLGKYFDKKRARYWAAWSNLYFHPRIWLLRLKKHDLLNKNMIWVQWE